MSADLVTGTGTQPCAGFGPAMHSAALLQPALAAGDRHAVETMLVGLDLALARGGIGTDDEAHSDVAAAVQLVRAGLSAVDGKRREIRRLEMTAMSTPLIHDVGLALPLLNAALTRRGHDELTTLPVPVLGASRRDLWRMTRMVLSVERGDATAARLAAVSSAHRDMVVSQRTTDCYDDPVRSAWTVLMARVAWLTGDRDLCRVTCQLLAPDRARFAVLGSFLPIGPIGWFVADPLHLLGDHAGALEANRCAELVSRRMRARAWIARCRLQREALLRGRGTARRLEIRERPANPPTVHEPVAAQEHPVQLSPRQLDILRLAAQGLTNAQIAGTLYLSVATVERHCTMAYRKLGVRNRAQALGVLALRATPVDLASGRRPERG